MHSAPDHPQEKRRLQALLDYLVLDTEAEQAFDELTQLASSICETPISLVSLIDSDRQWFKSRTGLDATETPRSLAFCAHAILEDGVFEVPDTLTDERFADNPLVTGAPNIRFYAGAPLVTSNQLPIGTLCVISDRPMKLTSHQRQALQVLARQVISQLDLRSKNRELELIGREREKILSTIAHDLRGPFNFILGYAKALSTKLDSMDPSRISIMARGIWQGSLDVFQTLDELLQWSSNNQGKPPQPKATPVAELVEEAHLLLKDAFGIKKIRFVAKIPENTIALCDETLSKAILRNLIANAIKYSNANGQIVVEAKSIAASDDGAATIEIAVSDEGKGVPAALTNKLFKTPLDSQLGTSGETGTGLGLQLCYEFAVKQGGKIWLDTDYHSGARIVFSLPKA